MKDLADAGLVMLFLLFLGLAVWKFVEWLII